MTQPIRPGAGREGVQATSDRVTAAGAAGYTPDPVEPTAPSSNRLVGERAYHRGTDRVLVRVGAEAQTPTNTQSVTSHVRVAGHGAVVTAAEGTCVTWTVRSGVHEGVCAIDASGKSPLPLGEILRIAQPALIRGRIRVDPEAVAHPCSVR